MNDVERLQVDLAGRFPGLAMAIDPPENPAGGHFLDIQRPGLTPIVVEWRPGRGFGVSTLAEDGSDFGLGPDEVYTTIEATAERVAELVENGGSTEPPSEVGLAELRKAAELTQVELAHRAGVKQAALAGLEARSDAKLSTLTRIIKAMGGSLTLLVRLPGGRSRVLSLGGGREAE